MLRTIGVLIIVQMHDWESQKDSLSEIPYVLHDENGYYISGMTEKIETREKMILIARFWAIRRYRYIKTGQAMQ